MDKELPIKSILIIGLFQILSLIPGVSRAGIVITGARFLKYNRTDSAKISFLLSIPALCGASVLSFNDILKQSVDFNYLVILAIVLSFFFSFITVKFFLNFIKKFSMNIFVVYRIALGLVLLFLVY
jgi:undecaprenyl-diphosphatase